METSLGVVQTDVLYLSHSRGGLSDRQPDTFRILNVQQGTRRWPARVPAAVFIAESVCPVIVGPRAARCDLLLGLSKNIIR